MSILLVVLNAAFLIAIVFVSWKKTAVLRNVFLPALLLKVSMGILLGVIYIYYYTVGDTIGFVIDGNTIATLASRDFSTYIDCLFTAGHGEHLSGQLILTEPRAVFLSKIVSLFSIITGGNYWLISVYLSLISFSGCWYFVKQIHLHLPSVTWPAVVSFLFFPSVVFWTSGVIKESLAIAALAFIAGLLIRFWFSSPISITSYIIAVFCIWVAWKLKYYFAAIFFSVVITTIITKLTWAGKAVSFPRQWISWIILFSALLAVSSFLHPNFSPTRFFRVIVENYQAFQQLSAPGDALQFSWMDKPGPKILLNAPAALIGGLFRPFAWETTDNFFQVWIGIENLIVAILTILAVASIRQIKQSPHRILILGALVYVFILCVLLTLSTPNFGTLSRYRTGYLPFFILLLLSSPKVNSFMERSFRCLVP